MAIRTYRLDPDNDMPYGFDLSKYLFSDEDIVSLEVAAVEPSDIIDAHDAQNDGKRILVYCRVQAGVTSGLAKVTLRYTTDRVPPRVEDRAFYINVQET